MREDQILIAGGGIAGLALGLTLHQIGLPFRIIEQVRERKPLGVGLNLQPNAVRELIDLGISASNLSLVGIQIEDWVLRSAQGEDIHSEPRGLSAGYLWPQVAVHRGLFHMMLYRELLTRAGAGCFVTGQKVVGYDADETGVTAALQDREGRNSTLRGALLVGADGIHSRVRAQMYPDQPPIHWGGALMWRGTTWAPALRPKPAFIGFGGARKRMVVYPISGANRASGLYMTNWIAEITIEDPAASDRAAWFSKTTPDLALSHFADWRTDWLDVPALISGASEVYQNPMIDRDPVPTWVQGRVALIGDAAHPMYPTGSNGASQAIVDARVLGAHLRAKGIGAEALAAFDAELCAPVSAMVLHNRDSGPFGILDVIEARRAQNPGAPLGTLMPRAEREAFMQGYREATGLAVDRLNAARPILPTDRL